MLSINPDVLIAQVVTFAIFAFLLWHVYLKPLGKHLKERSGGIAKALEDSRAAQAEAEKSRADVVREMEEFKTRQKKLLEEAREEGNLLKEKILAQARTEQETLLEKARLQVRQEAEQARRQIKQETAALIVQATRKILSGNLDEKTQAGMVEKFVKVIPRARK